MLSLKNCDFDLLRQDPNISDQLINYEHILKICKDQRQIPEIFHDQSTKILNRMRKNVSDFYSITALHYINAGVEGLEHFNCLLNAIIADVNNATIEELNIALGIILFKGHGKVKTSDRSYRTISTCPFLSKCLDLYLRDLYLDLWNDQQANTQYQGGGSSHELASLLVTEVIQHSLNVSDKPVFMIALDAESAFDRCLRQILVSELYKAKVPGAAIIFINNRLSSRKTVYEWDGTKLGPAEDVTGFEQGGINSSDYYKLYNNEQLIMAEASKLGVDIGSAVISSSGQADDVLLASNDIHDLFLLVKLTELYCAKYRVKLEPKKTKLLVFSNPSHDLLVKHAINNNQISINNIPVEFTHEAEHVGVLRSTSGNMPNILLRITKHKKALGAVLSAGLAHGHRGNPAASLRVHLLYCTPVLLSGLASLVLTQAEVKIIDNHYQNTLQSLQRLHTKTPRCIVYFLAGSLPGEAHLHLRQMSLFSMICHLPNDPLFAHANYALTALPPSAKSWFGQIRDICIQYALPHPLLLLENPPSKPSFKKNVKLRITEFWQGKLAAEASTLSSLRHLNPRMFSLLSPHPIWKASAGNAYECTKSTILAKMISGRYRTEMMTRFWSNNRRGFCLANSCYEVEGDLEHLLATCPALEVTRDRLRHLWCLKTANIQPLYDLIVSTLSADLHELVKFILDAAANPIIIRLVQLQGQLILNLVLYLTWAYAIQRQKLILIGKWPDKKAPFLRPTKQLICSISAQYPNKCNYSDMPPHTPATDKPIQTVISTDVNIGQHDYRDYHADNCCIFSNLSYFPGDCPSHCNTTLLTVLNSQTVDPALEHCPTTYETSPTTPGTCPTTYEPSPTTPVSSSQSSAVLTQDPAQEPCLGSVTASTYFSLPGVTSTTWSGLVAGGV